MDIQDNVLYQKVNIAISDVNAAYTAINDKGGTVPANKTITNLEDSIDTIPAGSGTATSLKDKKVVYPNDYRYTKTAPSNVSGYNDISINSSIVLTSFNVSINNAVLDLDEMRSNANINEYLFDKTSNNHFVNNIYGNYSTKYIKSLELTIQTDIEQNTLIKMTSYKIFTGFHTSDGDISILDNTDFDTFMGAVIISNMNNIITNNFPNKFDSISFDYVDYTAHDNIISDVSLTDYGHKIIYASNFSDYSSMAYILGTIDTIYGDCTLSNNETIDDYFSTTPLPSIEFINRYRIIYNINIVMSNDIVFYQNKNLFIPKNQQSSDVSARINNIKNKYSLIEILLPLNDIIDENNVRFDYHFSTITPIG